MQYQKARKKDISDLRLKMVPEEKELHSGMNSKNTENRKHVHPMGICTERKQGAALW